MSAIRYYLLKYSHYNQFTTKSIRTLNSLIVTVTTQPCFKSVKFLILHVTHQLLVSMSLRMMHFSA